MIICINQVCCTLHTHCGSHFSLRPCQPISSIQVPWHTGRVIQNLIRLEDSVTCRHLQDTSGFIGSDGISINSESFHFKFILFHYGLTHPFQIITTLTSQ
ncbi:hypothetical protein K474DRAFT_1001610 [Panus rudis PR-1116 ss-1]|nr:hypothetical protein K474DRAFT_1001610 [Panus rudis PR-1116 ss-1]